MYAGGKGLQTLDAGAKVVSDAVKSVPVLGTGVKVMGDVMGDAVKGIGVLTGIGSSGLEHEISLGIAPPKEPPAAYILVRGDEGCWEMNDRLGAARF